MQAPISRRELSLSNPIARAEFDHIRKQAQTTTRRRRLWQLGGLLVVVGIFGYMTRLLDQFQLFAVFPKLDDVYPIIALTFFVTMLHFITIMRTVVIAGETLAREKRVHNWEILLMTGVSAQRLIFGKWWAVICTVWRQFTVLALLRALSAVLMGMFVIRRTTLTVFPTSPDATPNALLYAVMAFAFVFTLTMLNMLLTTSAGIVGSLLNNNTSASASTVQVVRLAAVTLPVVFFIPIVLAFLTIVGDDPAHPFYQTTNVIALTQMSLFDNGAIAGASLANPYDIWANVHIGTLAGAVVMYTVLTAFLLWLAVFIAKRQGAAQG